MAKNVDYPKLVASLRKRIAQLETEVAELKIRRAGVRSDGTIDKYTDMEAVELRPLIIKRGGDPDEIVKGLHSRQRSIRMREWLRANSSTKATRKRRLSEKEVRQPANGKPKQPVDAPKKRRPRSL